MTWIEHTWNFLTSRISVAFCDTSLFGIGVYYEHRQLYVNVLLKMYSKGRRVGPLCRARRGQ